ncbi:hypothetical protein [Candidatus Thiothrix anitrata]|uniref:Uncharacterized protein n=1 Tax=Candidatus Thiothrix anitrata TaxID=2823902 RepID=A0ABX7X6T1_9GAMM|nr:hypothetical protein [Candidatus Thiothrix anitrata]QTR50485.1 hypothetical protein J8380_02565 [Candidatus Thiothrix anitrata]QTR50498.1 hypothetical protein J8380_02655 [Candidatus Thiothrix anitrata]
MFTRMLKALWLVVLLSGSVAMAETKPAAQETALPLLRQQKTVRLREFQQPL